MPFHCILLQLNKVRTIIKEPTAQFLQLHLLYTALLLRKMDGKIPIVFSLSIISSVKSNILNILYELLEWQTGHHLNQIMGFEYSQPYYVTFIGIKISSMWFLVILITQKTNQNAYIFIEEKEKEREEIKKKDFALPALYT